MRVLIAKETIYEGNLILVNRKYPIRRGEGQDLAEVTPECPQIKMKREANHYLRMLLGRIHACGNIVPVSGFRSAKEQTDLYDASLRENGEEFTKKFVALPYHSEHQTGLAIDLGLRKDNIDFICPEFPYDGICQAFRRNASRFGFIERYRKGKERITGIAQEPWHFRYVGYPHSQWMEEKDLTLEEYMEYIKQFSYGNRHLAIGEENHRAEIFYVPAAAGRTEIDLPEGAYYQVSGNNADGFIVTVWRDDNEQKQSVYRN